MDTEKVYNENAGKWLRLAPSSLSDFTGRPAVFDACGELNGRSVLDLGCGEGYCARELKRRGAGQLPGRGPVLRNDRGGTGTGKEGPLRHRVPCR